MCGAPYGGVANEEEDGHAMAEQHETATLGGGCFWCLEPLFKSLRGVDSVVSGYAGGHVANPSYRQVCNGDTGHAEVVQVTFDPQVIRFRDLLDVFFTVHDPTTPNRQGADVGPQYRSIVLFQSPEQERVARPAARVEVAHGDGVNAVRGRREGQHGVTVELARFGAGELLLLGVEHAHDRIDGKAEPPALDP